MLYCSYCDYHRILSVHPGKGRIKASKCEYANCIFYGNVDDMDMEYPCNMTRGKGHRKESDEECNKITA